jgi:hypothetical protein
MMASVERFTVGWGCSGFSDVQYRKCSAHWESGKWFIGSRELCRGGTGLVSQAGIFQTALRLWKWNPRVLDVNPSEGRDAGWAGSKGRVGKRLGGLLYLSGVQQRSWGTKVWDSWICP